MSNGDDAQAQTQPTEGSLKAAVPGLLLIAVLLGAIVLAVAQLAPDEAPVKDDPSVIDSIFSNVVVIAAARAMLLLAAVVGLVALLYIGVSAGARLIRGEWLERAGPFQAKLKGDAESAAAGLDDADDFFEEWMQVSDEKDELLQALEERDEAISQLLHDRTALSEEVERLRKT